jgi:hypothetical protein
MKGKINKKEKETRPPWNDQKDDDEMVTLCSLIKDACERNSLHIIGILKYIKPCFSTAIYPCKSRQINFDSLEQD